MEDTSAERGPCGGLRHWGCSLYSESFWKGHVPVAFPSSRYRICTTRIHYCNPGLFVCLARSLYDDPSASLPFAYDFFSLVQPPSQRFAHLSRLVCERNALRARPVILCRETMRITRDRRTNRRRSRKRVGSFVSPDHVGKKVYVLQNEHERSQVPWVFVNYSGIELDFTRHSCVGPYWLIRSV